VFADSQREDSQWNQFGLILTNLFGGISTLRVAPGCLDLRLLLLAVCDDLAVDCRYVLGIAPHESLELRQLWVIVAAWVALVDITAHAVAQRNPTSSDRPFGDVAERFPVHLLDVWIRRVGLWGLRQKRAATTKCRRE